MRVRIDAAGNDQPSFRIDRDVSFHFKLGADDRDDLVFDQDVGVVVVCGGDDVAVWMSVFMMCRDQDFAAFAA